MYSPLPFTSRQRVWTCRSLVVAIVTAALLAGNGCVIVENQSLVVDLPADKDSVEVVFVYEGISEDSKYPGNSSEFIRSKQFHPWHLLLQALVEQSQASGPNSDTEDGKFFHRLAKRTTLEETQYYLDKSRKCQLCAYQRLTFVDRTMLVEELNKLLNNRLQVVFQARSGTDSGRSQKRSKRSSGLTESEDKEEIAKFGSSTLS